MIMLYAMQHNMLTRTHGSLAAADVGELHQDPQMSEDDIPQVSEEVHEDTMKTGPGFAPCALSGCTSLRISGWREVIIKILLVLTFTGNVSVCASVSVQANTTSASVLNNVPELLDNRTFFALNIMQPYCLQSECFPLSCDEIYNQGHRKNGVYQIYPAGPYTPVNVYCDMKTDGGRWTVFQKRKDGSVDFYRNWNAYKSGFGVADGEYWLGLENIFLLTLKRLFELRVDLEDFERNKVFAKYAQFSISSMAINGEEEGYRLFVTGFTDGGAGDALTGMSGAKFSTYDHDQDSSSGNCASQYSGAFWYTSCHCANLNGRYLTGSHVSYANGVNWCKWKGYYYSVKISEMKMRQVH
ncbi:microfibril-associated glycoprotein 4-like [Protopterus annectens]|uniref:microfibril-associated glycoprotein 4-like n=1 Tax=Protopterus annectens TaxID=7888 RepID=UPI001CF9B790|nr:microfibril-associated glycoprotein 4-like [Protopterus annectens]